MKYVVNINTINKDSAKLDVNYLWTEDNISFSSSDITMNLTDISIVEMQELMASKLFCSADDIDTFIYQCENKDIELNRRFLINLIDRPIEQPIILNINPQFKTINNKKVFISASNFTEDEIGVSDPVTGAEIKPGIIDGTGRAIIAFIQTEINK